MKRLGILLLAVVSLIALSSKRVEAQISSTGVATPVIVGGTAPSLGSVICSGKGSYELCSNTYDTSIFGIVTTVPAASFDMAPQENQYLAVSHGKTIVQVVGKGGAIKNGDLLTSSERPGFAQKADRNGYVLGMALEDFNPSSPDDTTTLLVSLNIHPTTIFIDVKNNLFKALQQGLSAPILTPLAAMRYMIAAFVTVLSFILGFVYFGRFAKTGIEAIGRNPLARFQIQTTVIFNLLLMAGIFVVGLALSYFVLVL